MRVIELPTLRAAGDIVAVAIETTELAGQAVTVVTCREAVGRPPCRRWYPDPGEALAYAAQMADRHQLPLLDLRDMADSV